MYIRCSFIPNHGNGFFLLNLYIVGDILDSSICVFFIRKKMFSGIFESKYFIESIHKYLKPMRKHIKMHAKTN